MANYILSVGSAADFTTSRFPSGDLLPGENCMIRVTSTSGFTVTDEYDEIAFVTDFGDPGATYTVGGGGRTNDANSLRGRNVVHAWETSGAKTVTMTGLTLGGVTKQNTVAVTVMDPDVDITWDNDIYVSFAGDFTGAPAAGGAVQHISNITALLAFSPAAGEDTRITFRKGETYTWVQTTSGVDLGAGNITYIQGNTWGTGNRAKIVAGAPLNDNTLTRGFDFGFGADSARVVAVDIEFDGLYDPTTGIAAGGSFNAFYGQSNTTGESSVSLHKVVSKGCETTFRIGGSSSMGDNKSWMLVSDCHITDWENFALFGGWSNPGIIGCAIKQHPRAILRPDGKIAPPQAADHGPYRGAADFACISNNTMASTSGWSGGGTNNGEGMPQPCLRLGAARENADSIFSVHENVTYATTMIATGPTTNKASPLYGMRLMVEGNEHTQIRYHGIFCNSGMAGVYLHNNIHYLPDLFARSFNLYAFAKWYDPASDGVTGTIYTEALNNPITVRNNSVVSQGAASGLELDAMEFVYTAGPLTFDWVGTTPTETGNIVNIPNHPNVADFTQYTSISAGDRFKPVTGSTAIDAVTSGIVPVYDIDGNTRSLPANAGAHDTTVVSATTVTAPSNSAVPTIAELSSFIGEYAATDLGTWSNWIGDQEYLVEYRWNLNGVLDEKTCVYDGTAKSGTLALEVVATNRSGTRISATSSGMAI